MDRLVAVELRPPILDDPHCVIAFELGSDAVSGDRRVEHPEHEQADEVGRDLDHRTHCKMEHNGDLVHSRVLPRKDSFMPTKTAILSSPVNAHHLIRVNRCCWIHLEDSLKPSLNNPHPACIRLKA